MFVHALIRVSVLGVALPTSSAFISVEVTDLHGEALCANTRLILGDARVGACGVISLPLFAFRVSLRVMRLFGGQNISGQ